MPSHGIAYDTWAGQVPLAHGDDGFPYIPEHTSIGIHAGPAYGALAIVAAVIRARATGEGCQMELAQADAAAYFDWYRIETWRSYERPQDEVYGNSSDDGERRPPGTGGMKEGVRYQMYASADGHVLFMASEQEFWRNFCAGVDRLDLYERWPGRNYGDHARGNAELRAELVRIFAARTTAGWVDFGRDHNTPIAPVHTPRSVGSDPQFLARLSWIPKERLDADMLPFPVRVEGDPLPPPERAPRPGQHTDAVLRDVLGYDPTRVDALKASGATG
jgi:crotonobetainyl-CoA:carnitine CoA-transferase CaiB-like acyl-CoA transferase